MKKYIFFIVCLLSIHKHIDAGEWKKAMSTFEKVRKHFTQRIIENKDNNTVMFFTTDKNLTKDQDLHLHYIPYRLNSSISIEHFTNAFKTSEKNGHSAVQIVYDKNTGAYSVTPQTNSFLLPGGIGLLAIIALVAQQQYYRSYYFR